MNAAFDRDRAKRYSAVKTKLFVADLVMDVVFITLFQVFLSYPLSRSAAALVPNFYLSCLFYVTVFWLVMYLVSFPLRFYASFYIEHRFELSNQRFFSWFADEMKSLAIGFLISMAGIEVFYFVLRNEPRYWWIIISAVWLFFSVVMARLLPSLIIPLFYKYLPIKDEETRERLHALAERSGIKISDISQIDFSRKTKKANAALVGLGKTRKVILADTLMDNFTRDEVEAVAAHEFGHHKYAHIWQLIFFSGAATFAGFFLLSRVLEALSGSLGASGVSDLYLFPVLVMIFFVFSLLILPAQNYFSRVLERQADMFALKMTGNKEAFISCMQRLASMNLADVDPSAVKKFFLYDHPPISERIRMAERYNAPKNG